MAPLVGRSGTSGRPVTTSSYGHRRRPTAQVGTTVSHRPTAARPASPHALWAGPQAYSVAVLAGTIPLPRPVAPLVPQLATQNIRPSGGEWRTEAGGAGRHSDSALSGHDVGLARLPGPHPPLTICLGVGLRLRLDVGALDVIEVGTFDPDQHSWFLALRRVHIPDIVEVRHTRL